MPAYAGGSLPAVRRAIDPISTSGATAVNIEFTIAQRSTGAFEYGINGVPFAKNHPISAKPGETQVWTITNKTKWSHPFHLHGFFFQVLDDKGRPGPPARMERHRQRPAREDRASRRALRRQARQLDVSLPRPRPRRRRADGHGRPRRPARGPFCTRRPLIRRAVSCQGTIAAARSGRCTEAGFVSRH